MPGCVWADTCHRDRYCTADSHDDLRYVVEYARLRGIRVIPEFDSPAHASSWNVGYPGTTIFCGCTEQPCPPGSFDPVTGEPSHYSDVLDPVSNTSFALLSGFLREMAAVFPDEQVHFGECTGECACMQLAAETADGSSELLSMNIIFRAGTPWRRRGPLVVPQPQH
jgi:N-acetyl-beta-hexosaminidase